MEEPHRVAGSVSVDDGHGSGACCDQTVCWHRPGGAGSRGRNATCVEVYDDKDKVIWKRAEDQTALLDSSWKIQV